MSVTSVPAATHTPTPTLTATPTPTQAATATATATPPPTTTTGGAPSDLSAVASPLDQSGATSLISATQFLYSGPHAAQTGVASGAIELDRTAVLRGVVLTRDGQPLSGVTITILGHPEFGQTVSRDSGQFDLAVNGGGLLTVTYAKDGYLPVQRQAQAPWQDYAVLPDVRLVAYDPHVTTIDLSASNSTPVQVAQGRVVSDTNGTRQAALLFTQGTTAMLAMSDGATQPLSTLTVRATEYTVGAQGPQAMPAALPPSSGYTYAADFSTDEALAAGAITTTFSQPVPVYVQNILHFGVGSPVPAGYYDRVQGHRVASQNGLVIGIIAITTTNGMTEAELDVGAGQPATATTLAALGITDAERAQLARLYPVGTSLWRAPITHFSPWDFNWPFGPPPGAQPPKQP